MIELNLQLNIFHKDTERTFSNKDFIYSDLTEERILNGFKERIKFLVSNIKEDNLSYGWLDDKQFYCSYFITLELEFYMTATKNN